MGILHQNLDVGICKYPLKQNWMNGFSNRSLLHNYFSLIQSRHMIPITMCLDDDPIVLMLNDLILKEQFFCDQLIKLDKAELALNYFREQANLPATDWSLPNIIFLDINMPVMDGWEFLEIFTKEFPQFHEIVKVVILSSSVNPADLELAKNHPLVINFIPKPIGETELEILKKHESIAAFF